MNTRIVQMLASTVLLAPACSLAAFAEAASPLGVTEVVERTVVIDAPAGRVWHAISTKEGLEGWIAPEAEVELAIGGAYEIHFWPDRPVGERGIEGTRILSFVPGRMLSYHGSSPPSFPKIHLRNVSWVTFTLEELPDGKTEVRQAGAWPSFGEDWEADFREWVDSALQIGLGRLAAYLERGEGLQATAATPGR